MSAEKGDLGGEGVPRSPWLPDGALVSQLTLGLSPSLQFPGFCEGPSLRAVAPTVLVVHLTHFV